MFAVHCAYLRIAVVDPTSEIEASIQAACARADFHAAASTALRAYGPEVLAFLQARLGSESSGEEVFSMFAEDAWRGLPAFAFRCTVRAWLYTVARNAANRFACAPHNRPDNNLSISERASLSKLIAHARSATEPHQLTDVKERMRSLRERLDIDDQTLLILHVDRGLSWRELALVMHDGGDRLEDEKLTREAARLRKRFERVKAELRAMAVEAGLLPE
jgi:RNA polymerase sigma-70 factor (ECF subfamily)